MSGPPEQPSAATAPQRALRPRDAATLVVVETAGPEPRVLMGRRRADLVQSSVETLLTDCAKLAGAITGSTVYVDNGYHAMGMAVDPAALGISSGT